MQHTSRQTRTDRIHELAGVLRRGVATSVPELALRFGVSERTIARDITFLRDHEMPVKGKPGRYGGLVLVQEPEEAFDLSDEEVAALWLAVWTTATRSASGAEPGHSAFVKIERALSRERRRRLRALTSRVLIGAAAGRHLHADSSIPRPGVVAALATAFARRNAVEIDYEDREGARTRRTVEPHALLVQVPLWYLLAHDLGREAPRMFRVDRIRRAHALGDPIRSRLDLWSAFDLVLMGVRPR